MANNQKKRLGIGISIISTLLLISYSFCIIIYSFILLKGTVLKSEFIEHKIAIPSLLFMKLSVILSIIGIVSIILIITKKHLGIYLYYICVIAALILHVSFKGFSANIVTSLILPAIMACFLLKNKEIFS